MSINKSISYLLCNKGIIVNLYKLYFLSSHFSFQPNKRVFYSLTFPSLQPNTYKGKLNIFYPPTNFSSSYFSTPPTKRTLNFFFFSFFRWERERQQAKRKESTRILSPCENEMLLVDGSSNFVINIYFVMLF